MFVPVMGNAGAAGAAAAAAIAQAIKASGAIVHVETHGFESLLRRQESPLVVHCHTGFFSKKHRYLSGIKGLAFYAESPDPLSLPPRTEVVEAKSFWMPH